MLVDGTKLTKSKNKYTSLCAFDLSNKVGSTQRAFNGTLSFDVMLK